MTGFLAVVVFVGWFYFCYNHFLVTITKFYSYFPTFFSFQPIVIRNITHKVMPGWKNYAKTLYISDVYLP